MEDLRPFRSDGRQTTSRKSEAQFEFQMLSRAHQRVGRVPESPSPEHDAVAEAVAVVVAVAAVVGR